MWVHDKFLLKDMDLVLWKSDGWFTGIHDSHDGVWGTQQQPQLHACHQTRPHNESTPQTTSRVCVCE